MLIVRPRAAGLAVGGMFRGLLVGFRGLVLVLVGMGLGLVIRLVWVVWVVWGVGIRVLRIRILGSVLVVFSLRGRLG